MDVMGALLGKAELLEFMRAMDEPCPVSVRMNGGVAGDSSGKTEGTVARVVARVPWCVEGAYLEERPSFTMDPLFHGGAYYVQEASSMFVAHVVDRYVGEAPVTALDLCAAPGGKTTLLIDHLPKGSLLVANEVNHRRSNILAENVSKWLNAKGGLDGDGCVVTNNEPGDFGKLGDEVFDFILCDVPCSGEGMFRKDERAIAEWSLKNVDMCWKRQRAIIADIWDSLKEGGLMIYSTCTYNTKEDEENVRWIRDELGAEVLDCGAEPEWNLVGNLLDGENFPCCHLMPHRVKGEGFFCAVLRKGGEPLREAEGTMAGTMAARRKLVEMVRKRLRVIPLELWDVEAPVWEVGYDEAVSYLRGDALRLDDEAPRGMIAVTYRGFRLGMVKNIGQRANNLYPKEWRIRKVCL